MPPAEEILYLGALEAHKKSLACAPSTVKWIPTKGFECYSYPAHSKPGDLRLFHHMNSWYVCKMGIIITSGRGIRDGQRRHREPSHQSPSQLLEPTQTSFIQLCTESLCRLCRQGITHTPQIWPLPLLHSVGHSIKVGSVVRALRRNGRGIYIRQER